MKGILLAGGKATRLFPATKVVSKQLLPVYDKPMIYYPLSVLMLADIREILIISTPTDLPKYKELLGDGSQWGLSFSYAIQDQPRGLPDAFIVGREFIGNDNCCLILGDNLIYGQGLTNLLREVSNQKEGSTIFGYNVKDPERSGVVEFDENNKVLSIEEKPLKSKSNYAILGLYFFDNSVIKIAEGLIPSVRGELEMVDIHKEYLRRGNLRVKILERGFAWLDTGTFDSLADAGEFIKVIQNRQGTKVYCPEEVAYRMHFIDAEQLKKLAEPLMNSGYGKYLLSLISKKTSI